MRTPKNLLSRHENVYAMVRRGVHVHSEAMASMNGKNQSNQLQATIIPLEKRRAWCHYQASRQVSTIQGKKVTEWTMYMYVLMKDGANPVCEPVLNATVKSPCKGP